MKKSKILLIALFSASFSTATMAAERKEVKVVVNDENGTITKTVTVNDRKLSAVEIAEMEANGELDKHPSFAKHGKKIKKMMFIGSDDDQFSDKDIEVFVDTTGGKITKKVIINGKELSADEIAKMEANGTLKTIHLDTDSLNIGAGQSHKVMVFKSDKTGVNGEHKTHVKTDVYHLDDSRATLGFMTNIKEDGWHVISVIEGSGAEESGLKTGDIIKFMGDKNLTQDNKNIKLMEHQDGEQVNLEILRDNETINMTVEARKNNSFDMMVNGEQDHSWTSKLKDLDFDSLIKGGKSVKVMVLDGDDASQSIDLNNFDISIPDMLGNMNIFVTDGASTSKLLGKNHEMSTLSDGMSRYFGTKGGVLLIHVDDDNVFNLEDGDVIKSVAGVDTDSPKDVIKQLLNAKDHDKIKIKVVRHKRNKTLTYQK